jgi:Zn-dependent M32 family carboxypeptidase
MKLQELESRTKIQQSLKVFESHFGQSLAIDAITIKQAQRMLSKVRGLIREHRSTSDFHRSEQNPSYLKLVVMERALEARMKESQPGAAPGMAMAQQDPRQQAADAQATAAATKRIATGTGQANKAGMVGKAIDSAIQGKTLTPAEKAMVGKTLSTVQQAAAKDSRLQQMLKTATTAESKNRRLKEASELQQAQVVLAAQDMVDQIQKMIEQVSAMQFKDLPALVDSIRNDVGMDQAQQFNNDVTTALQGLIQGLQGSKVQLETAQGVVTGQAPVVPGQDAGAAGMPDMDGMAVPGADTGEEPDLSLDANLDIDAEEIPAKALGRERR